MWLIRRRAHLGSGAAQRGVAEARRRAGFRRLGREADAPALARAAMRRVMERERLARPGLELALLGGDLDSGSPRAHANELRPPAHRLRTSIGQHHHLIILAPGAA